MQCSADDSSCLNGASHDSSAPRGFLQGRYCPSAQRFPENAGPYGSGFAGTSVESASHAIHPVLSEAEGSIRGLASGTPLRKGDSGLCISPGLLERPLLAKARRDLRHGEQKEGCHDSSFQQVLGSAVREQTDLRLWSEEESGLHINCLEMLAVCQACQFFLPYIRRHHVLVRSNSRSVESCINHQGGLAHEWPSLPLYAFPPVALLPQLPRRVRKQWHKLILIAPLWRNQPWVSALFQLLKAAPWLIPLRRDLLSQANGTIWHPRPELWALHVWLLDSVLNTMVEARTLSTRRLYALKWYIFSTWCQDRNLDPVTSDVSVVLSFLQEMLDKQRSSSTSRFTWQPLWLSMPLLLANLWAEIVR